MSGLERLLFRITPIFMLICFICLGITHTFQTAGAENITYLSETYYDKTNFQPIDNPTEQQKEQALKVYEFDTQNYVTNINQNILKRATTNTIQFDTYQETINAFNLIWEDGYQPLDILKTILNACILVVNTVLIIINVIITPLRITSGILLTGFSVLGININRQTPITTALQTILDSFAIALIQPVSDNTEESALTDTAWHLNNEIEQKQSGYVFEFTFDIVDTQLEHSITCNKLRVGFDWIKVTTTNNEEIYIYRNGQWIDDWRYGYLQIIWIYQDMNATTAGNLTNWLNRNATEYTLPEE